MGSKLSEHTNYQLRYPIFISLGVSILFFAATKSFINVDVSNLESWNINLIIEFSGIFIATLLCVIPLYIIISKLQRYREKINFIKDKLDRIESNLSKPLIKQINEIDEYVFKEDRHPFYIERLKKISSEEDHFFYNVLYLIITSWKKITNNKKTELTRILVQRQLDELKKSIDDNILYFSLSSYLNFILDLIEICFQIEGEFIYHSFTNATPDKWFDGNIQELRVYREEFSEILKNGSNQNQLCRTVLCYQDERENKIESKPKVEEEWEKLSPEAKNIYLRNFVKNSNPDYLILDNSIVFNKGFNEIIYLGYIDSDNDEKHWKWCLVTQYIPDSSVVKFSFYNLNSEKEIILLKGDPDLDFTNSSTKVKQSKLEISLLEFIELVYSDIDKYLIDGDPIMKIQKFKNDTNQES